MNSSNFTRPALITGTIVSVAAAALTLGAPAAQAGSHWKVPGMELCMNPPCPPPNPGGLVNPPAQPPGGGNGGGFGSGLGAGIGLGVGLGIAGALTQPQQPQVIIQQQPAVVQPQQVYTAPAPQAVSNGLSPHDQYCLAKYKSYNIQTKQFLSFSGQYKFCNSPYR